MKTKVIIAMVLFFCLIINPVFADSQENKVRFQTKSGRGYISDIDGDGWIDQVSIIPFNSKTVLWLKNKINDRSELQAWLSGFVSYLDINGSLRPGKTQELSEMIRYQNIFDNGSKKSGARKAKSKKLKHLRPKFQKPKQIKTAIIIPKDKKPIQVEKVLKKEKGLEIYFSNKPILKSEEINEKTGTTLSIRSIQAVWPVKNPHSRNNFGKEGIWFSQYDKDTVRLVFRHKADTKVEFKIRPRAGLYILSLLLNDKNDQDIDTRKGAQGTGDGREGRLLKNKTNQASGKEEQDSAQQTQEDLLAELGLNDINFTPKEEKKLRLKGNVSLAVSQDLKDSAKEHHHGGRGKAQIGLAYMPEDDNLLLKAVIGGEYLDNELFGQKTDADLNLDEAYLSKTFYETGLFDFIDLKIGKFFLPLGRIVGVQTPMDAVNPRYQKFFDPEDENSKIASWLIEADYKFGNSFLKTFIKPIADRDEFDYFGTDWSLLGYSGEEQILNNLPGFQDFSLSINESKAGSEWGFDYNIDMDSWDAGFNFYSGYADLPAIKNKALNFSNDSVKIDTYFPKFKQYGLYWSGVWHDREFRGEIIYKDEDGFFTKDYSSLKSPILSAIIERVWDTEWGRIIAQLSDTYIIDYDQDILYNNRHNVQVGLEWHKENAFNDYTELYFRSLFGKKSAYFGPGIKYNIGQAFAWSKLAASFDLRADIFTGNSDSLIGSRRNNSQIVGQLRIDF